MRVNKKSFIGFPIVALMSSVLFLTACSNEEEKNEGRQPITEQQNNTKNEVDSGTEKDNGSTEKDGEESKHESSERDSGGYIIGKKLPEKEHYVKGVLIANKMFPMPSDFEPGESVEARKAFNKLNEKAKKDGFEFDAFSTYRSYDRQKELYDAYVARDGKEKADTYSARPGYSEHQTGLAFDIGEVGKTEDYANDHFGETAGGKWLSKNAHKYGFIIRYPEGKTDITGYKFESWHYRYVGTKIATEIYKNKSTLEEYLGVEG